MATWDLVGRDALVDEVVAHLRSRRPVLARGPRGAGRSSVLTAVAARLAAEDPPPRTLVVHGRERQDGVPLMPWAAALGAYGADLGEPLTIYTRLPRQIAADVDVLLVDDLDLLDAGSALLLVQLLRLGVPVVAATTSGAELPEALRDVAVDLRPVEVGPLDDAVVAQVAGAAAGAPLAAPTASQLVAWSQGLPGAVVALVVAAREAGRMTYSPAGARVVEPVVPDRILVYAGVDPEVGSRHREVLELLAAAGELPVAALDAGTLATLTRAGWADVVGDGVSLTHPLLTAWCLHRLGPAQRRHLYRTAAALMQGIDPAARLTSHLTTCGGRHDDPLAVVEAAGWLCDRRRYDEAAEVLALVETSTDPTVAWRACLHRARVHRELGRRDAALQALDDAAAHAQDDEQLIELVQRWEALLGGWVEDDDALEDRITRLASATSVPESGAALLAILQRRRAILGERRSRGGSDVATDPIVTLLREAMGGSLDLARAHFVPPPDEVVRDDEDLDELLQVLGRFLGLVYDGALVAGRAEAEHRHARALREALPSLGLWSYNRTKIAFHAGEYQLAVVRGREMRRHLAWRDVAGQGLPGEALLAAALARAGHPVQARAIVDRLGTEERKLPRVRLGVHRVLADEWVTRQDPARGAALLHEAGCYAVEQGEGHSGLLALDEAFALDPTDAHGEAVVALAHLSGIAAAAADRVHAVRAGDAEALETVGARFLAMPLFGRAAQCWEAASLLHERAGRGEAARRVRSQALVLRSEQGLLAWPRPRGPLTPRELEIARLAAERVRSKEIALRLGLSPRTVDNHLASIYRKLDVTGRDGLPAALALRAAT